MIGHLLIDSRRSCIDILFFLRTVFISIYTFSEKRSIIDSRQRSATYVVETLL